MKANVLPYAHLNAIIANYNEPVLHAMTLMSKFNIRHLPIVDEKIKLVGIITASDIVRLMYETGDPRFLDVKLSQMVPEFVITAYPTSPLVDSFLMMAFSDISGLPIVEEEEIIGILTVRDVISIDHLWKEMDTMTITPYEGIGDTIVVENAVTPDHSIWQVLDLMEEINIRQVLVLDDRDNVDKVISILDIFDQILHENKNRRFNLQYLHQTAISEVYTTTPISITVPVTLGEVRKSIISNREELILLNSQKKVVKAISEYDLFKHLTLHYQEKYSIELLDENSDDQ